jgi:hypothetical protein
VHTAIAIGGELAQFGGQLGVAWPRLTAVTASMFGSG